MKFYGSIAVYLFIGVVLCAGILQTFKGSYWLLIVSLLCYLAVVAKVGCLPKSH